MNDTYANNDVALAKGVDIVPGLAGLRKNYFRVQTFGWSHNTILVPEAVPYPKYSAYLRNATSGEFFVLSIVSFVAVLVVLVLIRYVTQKKLLISQTMADVINLLMNDNGFIRYNQLCHSEIAVIDPLTFTGLVVTNGILSSLQSHVTRPVVLQHQVHSIEDIYHSPFPVVVLNEQWRDIMIRYFSDRSEYKDWDDKIIVNNSAYHTHCELYEGTMAFFDGIYAANPKTSEIFKHKRFSQYKNSG